MEGKVLGRYRLLEEIGQGGMSVVYRGVDTTLDREVAVKILHPHLSRKASSRNRFAREAKAVARLHHDNILEIYDFSGDEAKDAYIVTELVRGETLEQFIEGTGGVACEVGCLIVAEIADAVAHAHHLGVIHRDIKTENVMIREDGVIKLMDFGIARLKEEVAATLTGLRMGTPHYMSPEQAAGTTSDIDERADVFALGVLLYRLAAKKFPFEGANPAIILMHIIEGDYEDPTACNAAVGRKLARVIQRALSPRREMRYPDARTMREALQEVIEEAGLSVPRTELRRFFTEPDSYTAELNTRLIKRYTELGNQALNDSFIPRAIELFNRVLVLDPKNEQVKAALQRLGRRRRRGMIATAGVVAITLVGGASYGLQAYLDRPVEIADPSPTEVVVASPTKIPSPTEVVLQPTPTPTVVIRTPTPTRIVAVASSATPAVETPKPTPVIPAGMGHLYVRIPESAATVYVDDLKNRTVMVHKFKPIELEAGPHTLRIELPGTCDPFETEIVITAGETFTHKGYLTNCPTSALFKAPYGAKNLEGATVVVSGKPLGKFVNGKAGPFEVRSGKQVVQVQRKGFLTAGDNYEIRTKNQSDAYVVVSIKADLVPAP